MKRILGLDLGTNSIGWAVVDELSNGQFDLVKRDDGFSFKGVHIFQEGVKIEKGTESSKASERTEYRSARRLKFRRKLRKIRTLKVLSEAGLSPALSEQELKNWQSKKIYPLNKAFREWCKTSEQDSKNPYYYRWLAASESLDLGKEEDCFKIGRAFYHMAQRRGFKSNRLESTPENETGSIKKEISELSRKMNGRTLGQYFWEDCYRNGKPIRRVHTSRDEHYLKEFNTICEKQRIPAELKEKLFKAIFFQRPLKSQKGSVAKCPFEPRKKRCPISHPLFEEFRMLQVLNNIKIKFSELEEFRNLSEEEFEKAKAKFFRVSKTNFEFKDISKELSKGKNKGAIFNYKDYQSLAGCPTISRLKRVFGEDYQAGIFESYTGGREGKSSLDVLNEVWNVLFSFNDEENAVSWAKAKLGLDDESAEKFAKIQLKQGYASLSLKAIKKILPYLEQGLIYSHAVFFGNLKKIVGTTVEEDPTLKTDIVNLIDTHTEVVGELKAGNKLLSEFKKSPYEFQQKYDRTIMQQVEERNGEFAVIPQLHEQVADYLVERFGAERKKTKALYHPSKEETYKPVQRAKDGNRYLGSPRISSIKNPVFMRAMHRLKAVINELLEQGVINDQTIVHIEMAGEMNDANKRIALRRWNKKNETKHKDYAKQIEKNLGREADEDEILKYQFWEEQNHGCVYCGNKISVSQMLSAETEIEHTIPRSLCCDNSQENKTLAHRECNREKKNRIPFECEGYNQILNNVMHWKKEAERLHLQVEKKVRASQAASTKEMKDSAIQERLLLQYERDYLREKYRRFIMEEVKPGFKNSQLVDTRIITKYARLYLKSLFKTVYSVSGKTTDACRKEWGLGKKSRDNHTHHTIDAIICACLTRNQYDKLASFYHEYASYAQNDPLVPRKPHFSKPWETFAEDMTELKNQILVSHYAPNHLLKQTKKKLRKKGKPVLKKGKPIYQQGKTARGSLHRDTFYGRINDHGDMKYVVRVPLVHNLGGGVFGFDAKPYDKKDPLYIERQNWKTKDLERIVDPIVRDLIVRIVQQRMDKGASFKDALSEPIWMNEDRGVAIKRVRCVAKPKGIFPVKSQRDIAESNRSEWKREYYVENDENYLISFYGGESANGGRLIGFKVLNNFTASNAKAGSCLPDSILIRDVRCELRQVIKIGDAVLVYRDSPDELRSLTQEGLSCRLYKVFGINGLDGRIQFRHHMEARDDKNQDKATASFSVDEPVSKIKVSPSNLKVLVDGVGFRLNVLGEIEFMEE